jgi:hypothetical protein
MILRAALLNLRETKLSLSTNALITLTGLSALTKSSKTTGKRGA